MFILFYFAEPGDVRGHVTPVVRKHGSSAAVFQRTADGLQSGKSQSGAVVSLRLCESFLHVFV